MDPVNRLAPRAILMAIVATFTLAPALASWGSDDAGTYADAGNTKATATVLADHGTYHGFLSPRDVDWYHVGPASAAPRCIQATATGENNDTIRLTVDSLSRNRSLTGRFPAGGSTVLALAVPDVQAAYFDIAASPNSPHSGDPARPGGYAFTTSAIGIPAMSMGDALTGGDAGDAPQDAAPASGPCFGGRIATMANLGDRRDVYSIQVPAGQSVTYGFAATGDPGVVMLTLLDAAGNAMGPALTSGQHASVDVPTGGTYYLSVARTQIGANDIGYLVSVIVGPPDPNGCRPGC